MSLFRTKRQAGFTLVELLVVVVVIGILVAISLVSLMNALEKARQRATMADMRTISKAVEAYMVDNSVPPLHNGGISTLSNVLTPYHSSVMPIQDHWDTEYDYVTDGLSDYTVESFGKDGVNGANINLGNRFDFTLDIVIHNGVFIASPE